MIARAERPIHGGKTRRIGQQIRAADPRPRERHTHEPHDLAAPPHGDEPLAVRDQHLRLHGAAVGKRRDGIDERRRSGGLLRHGLRIGDERGILGEEPCRARDVARFDCRAQTLDQTTLRATARRLDTRPGLLPLQALPRAVRELPAMRGRLADDAGNLRVVEVERFVQHECGPLIRRELLEQQQQSV